MSLVMRTQLWVAISIQLLFSPVSIASDADELAKLRAEVATLRAENAKLKALIGKPGTASTSAATGKSANPEDKYLADLTRLAVVTPAEFADGSKPISRAEFVALLVKANNAFNTAAPIKLAASGAKASFPDMPAAHKQFRYVQGMADAGWSIGYDDKSFKPEKTLTREEMIAIKTPLDEGEALKASDYYVHKWGDWEKISKRFIPPMEYEKRDDANWTRVFGATKICDPQKAVTRAEAVACVWQIGLGSKQVNAGQKK